MANHSGHPSEVRNENKIKEVQVNAQNLSTQKASEKKGTRLQKENGYR